MATVQGYYRRLRHAGWHAKEAHRSAKVYQAWDDAGGFTADDERDNGDETVRLLYVPDDDPSSVLDGDFSNKEIEHLRAIANRDGVWGIVGQFWDGSSWQTAESCWGFLGNDLVDNGYDTDIKQATLDAWDAHLASEAEELEATRPDLYGVSVDVGGAVRFQGVAIGQLGA